ncbi:hypothetical protein BD560DRAFT_436087 [Blakeslea trispora]|nr:hypothetical protein BD560DRAFT_436087 [Blakeslea trispora]
MSVPASSAQIPTGHTHSVNRSGGVIALSHSDFRSGKAASVFVLTPIKLEVEAEAPREE